MVGSEYLSISRDSTEAPLVSSFSSVSVVATNCKVIGWSLAPHNFVQLNMKHQTDRIAPDQLGERVQ